MQFYILMLVIAPWLYRGNWLRILSAMFVLAWGWRFLATWIISMNPDAGSNSIFFLSTQLPGALDEFGVGLLLARFVRSEAGQCCLKKGEKLPWVPILIASGLFWAVLQLFWQYAGNYWQTPWVVISFRTPLALAFGAIIFAACCLKNKLWIAVTAPLRYAGVISYGIYLWHLPVIMALKRFDWLSADRALPVVLVLTLVFSIWSWHFFEKPLLMFLGKTKVPCGCKSNN